MLISTALKIFLQLLKWYGACFLFAHTVIRQAHPSFWRQNPAYNPLAAPGVGSRNGNLSLPCSVLPSECPASSCPNPLRPPHLPEDLYSLRVIMQHDFASTVAMGNKWEPKGLKRNSGRCSTMGFHIVPATIGVCSITLLRVKTAPLRKCIKRKWDRGRARPLPSLRCCLTKLTEPSSVKWAGGRMQSWRDPLSHHQKEIEREQWESWLGVGSWMKRTWEQNSYSKKALLSAAWLALAHQVDEGIRCDVSWWQDAELQKSPEQVPLVNEESSPTAHNEM